MGPVGAFQGAGNLCLIWGRPRRYVCKKLSSCILKMRTLYDQLYLNLKIILRRKKNPIIGQVWEPLAWAQHNIKETVYEFLSMPTWCLVLSFIYLPRRPLGRLLSKAQWQIHRGSVPGPKGQGRPGGDPGSALSAVRAGLSDTPSETQWSDVPTRSGLNKTVFSSAWHLLRARTNGICY